MGAITPAGSYPLPWDRLRRTSGANGAMAEAEFPLRLATAFNYLASRGRIVPTHGVAVTATTAPDRDDNWARRWEVRYRSTPNGTRLATRIAAVPSAAGGTAPAFRVAAGAATLERAVPSRAAGTPTASDVYLVSPAQGEIVTSSATRDALSTVTLATNDRFRPVGWAVFEPQRLELDTGSDTCADVRARCVPGLPITDTELGQVVALGDTVFRKGQKHLVAYCVEDPLSPHTRVSATFANLLDQAVTGWTQHTPGWPLDTAYCATLSAGGTVVVTLAVLASCLGSGQVRARTSVGPSTPAAISAEAWYPLTVEASATEGEQLVIEFAGDGANACTVLGVSALLGSF